MESKYIVFPEKGKVALGEETVGRAGEGEILCVAEKSLVSTGTETYCLLGEFEPGTNWAAWVNYPFRPGYSMAGRVVDVGQGVTTFKAGDRVALPYPHQQVVKADISVACSIPDSVTDEDATWLSLALIAQVGARRAQLELGESVVVVGLGILGLLVIQYLVLSGARRIIAIDNAPLRVEAAKACGATHTLSVDIREAAEEIKKITDGRMADVVFDITGNPAVLAPSILLLRKLGRIVLLGDTPMPSKQHLGPGVVSNSIAILGVHASIRPAEYSIFAPWSGREMTSLFFDYLNQGRMDVSGLVTHRYSPLEAPTVYENLVRDRSQTLGVIFDWTTLT